MKNSILVFLVLVALKSSIAQHTDNLQVSQNCYIQSYGGGIGKNTFLKFDISSIPPNAIVNDVRFYGYIFNSQPGWDTDVRYIGYNNQSWLETDSNQFIWNTTLFTDTIQQNSGFGSLPGYYQSPNLSSLFISDFINSNSYFSFCMKDPDDPTCCPMLPGGSFTNSDSLLIGNMFGDRVAFRPRLYSNPNQRPYLSVTYGLPPTAVLPANGIFCLGNNLIIFPTITGDGPFSYQWLHNGSIMPGETNDTLSIYSLSLNDSGSYSVIVSGLFGIDTSNQMLVDISPNTTNTLGNDTTICNDETLTLDAGPGTYYIWFPFGPPNQTLTVDNNIYTDDTTTFNVIILKPDGCFSYDTVTVIFELCSSGIESIDNTIHLYPNPHDGEFKINTTDINEGTQIEIYNSVGDRVRSIQVKCPITELSINMNEDAPGIYYIHITKKNKSYILKTIKL